MGRVYQLRLSPVGDLALKGVAFFLDVGMLFTGL
jgi:hypothetical protein